LFAFCSFAPTLEIKTRTRRQFLRKPGLDDAIFLVF
jgi:hypothetical protein